MGAPQRKSSGSPKKVQSFFNRLRVGGWLGFLPGRFLSAFPEIQQVLCGARKNFLERRQKLRANAGPEESSVKIRMIRAPLTPLFFKKRLKFLSANLK